MLDQLNKYFPPNFARNHFFSLSNSIKWRFSLSPFCSFSQLIPPLENISSIKASHFFPNQSLVSESGEFKFGFFSSGCSSNSPQQSSTCYYIGIWLTYSSSVVQPPALDDTSGIAWMGKRENPISKSEPPVLSLSQNGGLILSQSQKLVWSSNISRAESVSSTVLYLLDTGNLILCDRKNPRKVLWQSFDHPSETWFPGVGLGFTNINGENIELSLVSWKSRTEPSPGMYLLEIGQSQSRGFIIREMPGNIMLFGTFPAWLDMQYLPNGLVTFNYTKHNQTDVTPYFKLYNSGSLQLIHNYYPLWSSPGANCGFHTFCGPNALCVDDSIFSSCRCPHGFSNVSSEDAASGGNSTAGHVGCVRNSSWNCHNKGSHDSNRYSFYLLQNLVKWADYHQYLGFQSPEECESACLNNCSCTAYAPGAGCNLWYGDLMNIVVSDGFSGELLYIRIAISDSTKKLPIMKLIIGGVSLIIFAICLILLWIFRWRIVFIKTTNNNDLLSIYSYAQIKHATEHFSVKLGEGGFGSVFKGRLFNDAEVAVKRLKIRIQEEKQFQNEVQTIGIIRHANLVRLLGFCNEGNKKILVYEYMSNGTLGSHLFQECSSILCWKERYNIAVGIAKGLTYLHEECRDCIIHCDVKPENVLLDENLVPKIADFGMAKLIGRDLSRVLTTIRGTMGYLAPEWYSGDAITQKADVYSFGKMLLEIISGKRNANKINNRNYSYFPLYALVKINEGEVLCLLDEKLGGNVNATELIRACKIAGWCIQDSEASRPSMRKVVLMLQGVISVGIPPIPRSLWNLVGADDCSEAYSG